jgi:hypothetical protein
MDNGPQKPAVYEISTKGAGMITRTIATLAIAGTLVLAGCDVDQTEEGELPDVDISAEGGNMPEYDVEGPEVDVEMKEKTVEVPDVDVDLPEDPEDDEN